MPIKCQRSFISLAIICLFANQCIATDFNIINFGAKKNKLINSASAIQKAINAAAGQSGSRVIIPPGQFMTGTISLPSGVELHLQKGATLFGSTNIDDYYALSTTSATFKWRSLIICYSSNHVSITGKGTIDGQGSKLAMNIDSLFYVGQLDSSVYQFHERRPKAHVRPQLIQFVRCEYVKVESVTIKNAASWVQVYDLCNHVNINDVKVESVAYWNNDGIDIIDCKNVRITNSYVNSSDDGICLKSYKRNDKTIAICDSIYIGNCTVRSSASAIKLGTSSYGGFKNIVIENIKVYDTYRSAIAIESWESGIIENIVVRNIKATNTGNALFIRLNKRAIYSKRPQGVIHNIKITNISCSVPFLQPDYYYNLRGPSLPYFHNVFPISIAGYPGANVSDVSIEGLKITYPGRGNPTYANAPLTRLKNIPEKIEEYPEFSMFGELPAWGLYVRHVNGLTLKNVKLKIKESDYRPSIVFDDVKELSLENIKIKGDKKTTSIYYHNTESK